MSLMSRVSPPVAPPVEPAGLLSAVGSTLATGLLFAPPPDTATGAAGAAGAAPVSADGAGAPPHAARIASAATSRLDTSNLRIIVAPPHDGVLGRKENRPTTGESLWRWCCAATASSRRFYALGRENAGWGGIVT